MSKYCVFAFHQDAVTVANFHQSLSLSHIDLNPDAFVHHVNEQALKKKSAIALLSPRDYQLLRVQKPELRSQDMLTAILWQEQEKFSLPVDQLAIDYVESPAKRLYIVAVAKRLLKERYQMMSAAGLLVDKITLAEFIYAQYAKKYYAHEETVIWINYFSDSAQAIVIYQGELVATLKLPIMDELILSQASITALTMFYMTEIQSFSSSPLWLFNGLLSAEDALLEQLIGRKQTTKDSATLDFYENLEKYNHSSVSHAYYGLMSYA